MGRKRTTIPFNCWTCGREGMVRPSQLRAYPGAGRFCTRACHHEYRRLHPETAAGYTGGRGVDGNGYVAVRVGPNAREREHRVVMEAHVGRKLEPWEHVHHRNGVKADNRLENLELLSASVHHTRHPTPAKYGTTEAERGRVVELYRSGLGTRAVAKAMGWPSANPVYRVLRDEGEPMRGPGRVPKSFTGNIRHTS